MSMDQLQALFVFLLILSLAFCQYQISFDPLNSPPLIIPLEPKDYVYSVPLNQMISKPIIVYIEFTNGSRVTNGPLASETFKVSTIDEKTAHSAKFPDVWATTGGKLCQKAVWWEDYPKRLKRNFQKVRCGSSGSATTLLVQAFNGKLILDWLYHEHTVIPPNKRLFLVHFKFIKAHSNLILVTAPAHHLTITQHPPRQVTANHDFSVIAEIRFENNSIVDTGLDSVLNVDLTIPYYLKIFGNTHDQRMILKRTMYRLSGKGVILNQGNYDWLMRKRAVKGRVVFNGIRILDPGIELKLNLTMTMVRDPWLRVPNCDDCYADEELDSVSSDGTHVFFREPDSYLLKKLMPVELTRKFDVIEQKLYKLSFTPNTLGVLKRLQTHGNNMVRITRNTEVPGEMSIVAIDHLGRRIHAGREANFNLMYKTIPKSVCISVDATRSIRGGYGELYFSICQIIDNVTLEIIPNIRKNASLHTPSFRVEGLLTMSHFGDFRYSGDGAQVQSHVNSFIKYAAYDINNGYILPFLSRQGFTFTVNTYETKSDLHLAFLALLDIEHQYTPEAKSRVIISSASEAITNVINPELWQLKTAFISTSNTASSFSDKEIFPYFNRVCWSENEILRSVFQSCIERKWVSLIIVREKEIHLSELIYHLAAEFSIDIKGMVVIDMSPVIKGELAYFKKAMGRLRSLGTKIVFLIATKRNQPYILRAAQFANLDSLHGYQWILYSKYAWQFPFANEDVCRLGIPCTKAFRGTCLFSETYNISGYQTEDWIRVLGYHFAVDRFYYKGGRVKYRPPEVGCKFGLGYDAVLLYASTVQKIVSVRETLNGLKVAHIARTLQVDGLTGTFKLNAHGDRIGFFGLLAHVNPFYLDTVDGNRSMMVTFTRSLKGNPDGTQLEIPYMAWRPGTDWDNPISFAVRPVSSKYNLRIYQSVSGVVNRLTQGITKNPSEPWPSIPYTRKEKVVPMFSCEQECGNNLLSAADINIYDTGKCDLGGRCVCNVGFHGNFCEVIDCKCKYGTCISASHCSCYPGWMGLECNTAICSECHHGSCTKPGFCKCVSSVYFGQACDFHIAIILVPVFIGSIIMIGSITLLVRYIIKHAERNAALSNSDWIIDWTNVTSLYIDDPTDSQTSRSDLSLYTQKGINQFLWKNDKWYGKHISSWTLDSRIPELRLEMVELVKLRHRNLITYAGACLTSPNVHIFLEIADKGSLNDIILNESIDLGWEFKYSFMRDICAGMKFLHEKTTIGSHGRLKSRNCLIDNRWTVRISGFGAHTIRFGRFRLPPQEKEELKNLFWIAPELLEYANCLDDVKNGTVTGDVYSFAIIVAEILTRAEPYEYELLYISEEVIIDMISSNDTHARKAAHKTWEDIGGADMFVCRPIIPDKFLPKPNLEKKQLLKMLDEAWNENPSGRPSFDKLGNIVIQIHTFKGELIDNLISLLELYSINLEMIVIERTKELEINKARAEQLLSQMLPRKVTSELKKGRKIPPEIFSSATVFFSDIVDFGRICQESTPLQIVDFLNETYNAFDEVLDAHDVYKVETISDSYMVVSGVPEKNGIKHASEIATMALHLMSTVTTFQIPHKTKSTLQLRIGMHSGPVVAGVVGMLMPRYCLFGDTVNTAARMESSSQALCIQASDSTAELLDQIGGFELESRGERQVKGRGMMTTYWIWGKDGFEMPMPDQSLAVSLSEHKFK